MLYEDQAVGYDERAGLPPEAIDAVAEALFEIIDLPRGVRLLEVGAGTGLLSMPLVARAAQYIGFDRSPAMLEVFAKKLDIAGLSAEIVVADGNNRWPADDGAIDAVFSSRALHHLEIEHIITEVRRVLGPSGGWLVTGRVRRDEQAANAILRRKMLELLRERGYNGRSGGSGGNRLAGELERLGGRLLPARVVAQWTTAGSPSKALASWQSKEGLAGLDLPADIKALILEDLGRWGKKEFNDMDKPVEHREEYEILSVDLRSTPTP